MEVCSAQETAFRVRLNQDSRLMNLTSLPGTRAGPQSGCLGAQLFLATRARSGKLDRPVPRDEPCVPSLDPTCQLKGYLRLEAGVGPNKEHWGRRDWFLAGCS